LAGGWEKGGGEADTEALMVAAQTTARAVASKKGEKGRGCLATAKKRGPKLIHASEV